jgi:hypothetical protein
MKKAYIVFAGLIAALLAAGWLTGICGALICIWTSEAMHLPEQLAWTGVAVIVGAIPFAVLIGTPFAIRLGTEQKP